MTLAVLLYFAAGHALVLALLSRKDRIAHAGGTLAVLAWPLIALGAVYGRLTRRRAPAPVGPLTAPQSAARACPDPLAL